MLLQDRHLWVIEDDEDCNFVYRQILDFRFHTRYFETIESFSKALSEEPNNQPDLVIADLMLKDGNFLNFLNSSTDSRLFKCPFIVVSSVDDVDALRFCFKEGALDYLTKPFKKNEILVKVENILREQSKPQNIDYSSSATYEMALDGHSVKNLTSKQYDMLKLFMHSENRSVSRQEILEKVWGETSVHPKTVDVHLYNLRRKLHNLGYMIRSDGRGRWTLIFHSFD